MDTTPPTPHSREDDELLALLRGIQGIRNGCLKQWPPMNEMALPGLEERAGTKEFYLIQLTSNRWASFKKVIKNKKQSL